MLISYGIFKILVTASESFVASLIIVKCFVDMATALLSTATIVKSATGLHSLVFEKLCLGHR